MEPFLIDNFVKIAIIARCEEEEIENNIVSNRNDICFYSEAFMVRDVLLKLFQIPHKNIKIFMPDSLSDIYKKIYKDYIVFQIGENIYKAPISEKIEEFMKLDENKLQEDLSSFITKEDDVLIFNLDHGTFQSYGSDKFNRHIICDMSIFKNLDYKSLTLINDFYDNGRARKFVKYGGQIYDILDKCNITGDEFTKNVQSFLAYCLIRDKKIFNLVTDIFKHIDFDKRSEFIDKNITNWLNLFQEFHVFCEQMSMNKYEPNDILEKFKFQKNESIETNYKSIKNIINDGLYHIIGHLASCESKPVYNFSCMLKLWCWINADTTETAKIFARTMKTLLKTFKIEEIYQIFTNEEGISAVNKLNSDIFISRFGKAIKEYTSFFGEGMNILPPFRLDRFLIAYATSEVFDSIFTECFLNPGGTQKIEEVCKEYQKLEVGTVYRSYDYTDPPIEKILTQELKRRGFDNWEEAMLNLGWTKIEGTFERSKLKQKPYDSKDLKDEELKKKERPLIEIEMCYGDEHHFCWIMNEFNKLLEPYDLYLNPYTYKKGDRSTYPNKNGIQLKNEMYAEANKYFHVSTVSDFFDFGEETIPDFLARYETDQRIIKQAFVEATRNYHNFRRKMMNKE